MQRYDLVVVGGGLAGLTAAVRGADLGLKTILLEQGTSRSYPCTTRTSMGDLHLGPESLSAEPDRIVATVQKYLHGNGDPAIWASLTKNARRVREWLGQQAPESFMAAKPGEGRVTDSHDDVLLPVKVVDESGKWEGNGSDLLLRRLAARLEALGGVMRYGAHVVGALGDGKKVEGVEVALPDGKRESIGAPAVVLADGGFQNAPDLVRQYIMKDDAKLVQRNVGTGSGASLRIAAKLGAHLINTRLFNGRLVSKDAAQRVDLRLFPRLTNLTQIAIVVDSHGATIRNAGYGDHDLAVRVAQLPDPRGFLVFDWQAWESKWAKGTNGTLPNPTLVERGGTLFAADTVQELAKRAGIPLAALSTSIAAYNDKVRRNAPDLPKAKGKVQPELHPIEVAPFYAIPVVPCIVTTYGGPQINPLAQVIGKDGKPIAGLYAAGDAAAGVEGVEPPEVGYIGGLGKALVTGFLAAEHAAASLKAG